VAIHLLRFQTSPSLSVRICWLVSECGIGRPNCLFLQSFTGEIHSVDVKVVLSPIFTRKSKVCRNKTVFYPTLDRESGFQTDPLTSLFTSPSPVDLLKVSRSNPTSLLYRELIQHLKDGESLAKVTAYSSILSLEV